MPREIVTRVLTRSSGEAGTVVSMSALRLLLNLVWLVLAGVWMAIGYVIAGVVCCVLIVTIPWGIAAFRIAAFTLWPFGRVIERTPQAGLEIGRAHV